MYSASILILATSDESDKAIETIWNSSAKWGEKLKKEKFTNMKKKLEKSKSQT